MFQTLEHTAGMEAPKWRVLAKCHDVRNLAEYAGHTDVDGRLLESLLDVASKLEAIVSALKA